MSLNKKRSLKKNKEEIVKQKKVGMDFDRIKRLKFLKDTFQKLPEHSQYKIENEVDYLRHITSVIPIIQGLKI